MLKCLSAKQKRQKLFEQFAGFWNSYNIGRIEFLFNQGIAVFFHKATTQHSNNNYL